MNLGIYELSSVPHLPYLSLKKERKFSKAINKKGRKIESRAPREIDFILQKLFKVKSLRDR
jgi:hypothetical protein